MGEHTFSWSDSLQAFSSCLPCLKPRPPAPADSWAQAQHSGVRRAGPNELEGLLAPTDTDTEEADAMSLHSNIGAGGRTSGGRRRRRRRRAGMTLFGWHLFGRAPAIQLPPDSDSEEGAGQGGDGRDGRGRPRVSRSSTLDSDAAPLAQELDAAAIARMQLDAREAAAAAEARRLEEERRLLRRERRELRAAKKALALAAERAQSTDMQPQAQPPPSYSAHAPDSDGDADADDADLGGQLYARRGAQPPSRSGTSNGSDSNPRSRTSASQSNPDAHAPRRYSYSSPPPPAPAPPRSSKSKSAKSHSSTSQSPSLSKSKSAKSHSSASQSPSLPSPATSPLPHSPLSLAHIHTAANMKQPPGEFEGFPMDSGADLRQGFPSAGFGGGRGRVRDMGAFLAHRGDA